MRKVPVVFEDTFTGRILGLSHGIPLTSANGDGRRGECPGVVPDVPARMLPQTIAPH